MEFIEMLFEPAVLLFTAPVLVALAFWLLTVVGLLDLDLLDADVDVEADVDAGAAGGGLPGAIGLGLVPVSLLLTLLLFFFGWTGIVLHGTLGEVLTGLGWAGWVQNLLFVPVALGAGTACVAGAARLLHPFFQDYGRVQGAYEVIGKIAVVKSGTVTPGFGAATVRTDSGPVEIAARTDAGAAELRYGEQALVVDYDADANTYLVERLALEDEPVPEPHAVPLPPKRLTS